MQLPYLSVKKIARNGQLADHAAEADEEVLFDAHRDNNGKGVSLEKMIEALKKIHHGNSVHRC